MRPALGLAREEESGQEWEEEWDQEWEEEWELASSDQLYEGDY